MTGHLLHIGMPKTASTWLQRHVFPGLSGFTYGNQDPTVARLVGALLHTPDDEFDPGPFRSVVAEYDANGARLLVSHEGLSGDLWSRGHGRGPERYARRLAAVLPGADILVVLRNQPEMLVALYAQYVNEGGTSSFARFLSGEHVGPGFDFDALEYDALVETYQGRFGVDRVWVFPYERLRADPASFLAELERRYETTAGSPARRRVNVSLSPAGLLALRAWNRLFRASPFNPSPAVAALPGGRRVRTLMQDVVDPALRRIAPAALGRHTTARAHAVAARYAASNARLSALTGFDPRALGYPS